MDLCVTEDRLSDYVGKPLFTSDRLYEGSLPAGTVTGLAWTALGGSVLYIEAAVGRPPVSTLRCSISVQLAQILWTCRFSPESGRDLPNSFGPTPPNLGWSPSSQCRPADLCQSCKSAKLGPDTTNICGLVRDSQMSNVQSRRLRARWKRTRSVFGESICIVIGQIRLDVANSRQSWPVQAKFGPMFSLRRGATHRRSNEGKATPCTHTPSQCREPSGRCGPKLDSHRPNLSQLGQHWTAAGPTWPDLGLNWPKLRAKFGPDAADVRQRSTEVSSVCVGPTWVGFDICSRPPQRGRTSHDPGTRLEQHRGCEKFA